MTPINDTFHFLDNFFYVNEISTVVCELTPQQQLQQEILQEHIEQSLTEEQAKKLLIKAIKVVRLKNNQLACLNSSDLN